MANQNSDKKSTTGVLTAYAATDWTSFTRYKWPLLLEMPANFTLDAFSRVHLPLNSIRGSPSPYGLSVSYVTIHPVPAVICLISINVFSKGRPKIGWDAASMLIHNLNDRLGPESKNYYTPNMQLDCCLKHSTVCTLYSATCMMCVEFAPSRVNCRN